MLKRVYVWEFPVRLTHWLIFLSIVALSITGFYIGAPFMHAVSEDEFIMATMRFIHFVSAYVFTVSFLVRIYWLFAGNRYARLNQFIPVSKERRKNVVDTIMYYAFVRRELLHQAGHNAFAGLSYFVLFLMYIVLVLTGFALYSESHVGGLWKLMGGWLLSIFSTGTIRLIHHATMWIVISFAIIHVYFAWLIDRVEKNGLISSIFSGYKTMEE